MSTTQTPVAWARWGVISRLIAQVWPMRRPPILILSFPRSGSSWVGETLGVATNASYLREPITQGHVTFVDQGSVFVLDPQAEMIYQQLGDKAFAGWPDFNDTVVRFPVQWKLAWRRPHRVVVKEINPFACGWYRRRYKPRIIFLTRHPAAVALSFHKLGWIGDAPAQWGENAEMHGRALRAAWDALADYHDYTLMPYETLCADPIRGFKQLCDFAGLLWDEWIQTFIQQTTNEGDRNDPWQIQRNSKEMIGAWRDSVSPEALAAVRQNYGKFDLPWYQHDEDW